MPREEEEMSRGRGAGVPGGLGTCGCSGGTEQGALW